MSSRRDFLRLMSLAMGSALLSSCGGAGSSSGGGGGNSLPPASGGAAGAPLPNGYKPGQIYGSGGLLPDGTSIMSAAKPTPTNLAFNGIVSLDDSGGEMFCAFDGNGKAGLYRTRLDYGTDPPTPVAPRLLIKQEADGQIYPANKIARPNGNPSVAGFGTGSSNKDGSTLLKVSFANGAEGLYIDSGKGLEPLCVSFQAIPGQAITLAQSVNGTATLHQGSDAVFVADFTRDGDPQPHQGLFYLPQGQLSQARVLIATGDVLPGTAAIVKSLCFSDFNDGLQYVVQGTAQIPGAPSAGTFCLDGLVGGGQRLLTASPLLGASEGLAGELYFAPRLGPASSAARAAGKDFRDPASAGQTGIVVHTDPETVALVIDGNVVLWGGGAAVRAGTGYLGLSPRGEPVLTINPPCFGVDGHVFFQVTTRAGFELVASNGSELRTLVGSGAPIGGKTINALLMGGVPHQVDAAGHVTFAVEYTDYSSGVIVACPL